MYGGTHRFTISGFDPELDVQPGVPRSLHLMLAGVGPLVDVGAGCRVTWSVDSADATVDASGTLEVAVGTPLGTRRKVTAVVDADGTDANIYPQTISTDVWTYTPAAMPQVGRWRETTRTTCDSVEVTPDSAEQIGELVVFASGLTWVTWAPFETYIDYSAFGTYTSPTVTLANPSGPYLPTDADLSGTYAVENGALVLSNMFLGTHDPAAAPSNVCGHRFVPL